MCKNKPYRKKKENMYLGCASVILQGSKHHSCSQQVMSGGTRSSQAQRTRVLILKKLLINSKNLLFNLKHTGPVGPPLQVHLCEPMWGLQPGMDLYIVGLEGCVAREAPEMVLHCSKDRAEISLWIQKQGEKYMGKSNRKDHWISILCKRPNLVITFTSWATTALEKCCSCESSWKHSSNDSPVNVYIFCCSYANTINQLPFKALINRQPLGSFTVSQ